MSMIPPGLQMCRLENFIVDPGGIKNETLCKALFLAQQAIAVDNSIVFSGCPGSGKTHLAVGIARAKITAGKSALFISMTDYLNRLKMTFNNLGDSRKDYSLMIDMLKKDTDCLVLDDLGVEKPTAWVVERLYEIINGRLMENLQTIITTNFGNMQEMNDYMIESPVAGERIVSRLMSFGWIYLWDVDDFRQRKWRPGLANSGCENGK
jgi:DNA replication protein DnaC